MSAEDFTGVFADVPFSHLLIRALDSRWTGTIHLKPTDGRAEALLEIERGLVSRVVTPDGYGLLGELLVDAGVIMEPDLELALSEGDVLGQTLIRHELLDLETLKHSLMLQSMIRLIRIFAWSETTAWSFSTSRAELEGMPRGQRVDTLRVLWAGMQTHGEQGDRIELTAERIGSSSFCVRREARQSRFGFRGDALTLANYMQGSRCTVADLLNQEIAPGDVVRQVVYLLTITRFLDFSPVGSESRVSGHPPETCPQNLDLRPDMGIVHEAIPDAFMMLADPRKRDLFVRRVRVSPTVTAELLHERAVTELSEGHAQRAQRLATEACRRDPENADFQTTSVWVRAHLPQANLQVLTADLDDILSQHNESIRARFYRGVLRRRQGYDAAAKRDFERVLGASPFHEDALRQLGELVHGRVAEST